MNDSTCILGQQKNEGVDGNCKASVTFGRTRLPYVEAYSMWCNLDIANMDFEDFIVYEGELDEDGYLTYTSPGAADVDGASSGRRTRRWRGSDVKARSDVYCMRPSLVPLALSSLYSR
ncbi:hypothetical protein BAUCODRAFT_30977 [Baudoinia panamericana UAMH 10762]|uniref:Uncharacterized protein n=1 Tax=Baudoinia panamericana (strain UAMH 10762) TaxID=717646 RepID=M2LVM2_BAUPA|nr:uncharacterized protein BAUCODRAFT_30977 [Baudoinia panamericana UAMH 10762]EMC98702.1 hypothetical protein BAUCODRAFT_30977 [Baudoinia panamericana UAMH 10762]